MKGDCDFSKGKRGRVIPEPQPERAKVKITIRLDEDVVERFLPIAEQSGAIRSCIKPSSTPPYASTWMAKRRESKRRCGELSVRAQRKSVL
jgi:hypothetical protein